MANACEALTAFQDQVLSGKIMSLLQNMRETSINPAMINKRLSFKSVEFKQSLAWCEKRNDVWLQYCAKNVIETMY